MVVIELLLFSTKVQNKDRTYQVLDQVQTEPTYFVLEPGFYVPGAVSDILTFRICTRCSNHTKRLLQLLLQFKLTKSL